MFGLFSVVYKNVHLTGSCWSTAAIIGKFTILCVFCEDKQTILSSRVTQTDRVQQLPYSVRSNYSTADNTINLNDFNHKHNGLITLTWLSERN